MTEVTSTSPVSRRSLIPRIFSRAQPTGAVERLLKSVRANDAKDRKSVV